MSDERIGFGISLGSLVGGELAGIAWRVLDPPAPPVEQRIPVSEALLISRYVSVRRPHSSRVRHALTARAWLNAGARS
jgi:hypothetical protein